MAVEVTYPHNQNGSAQVQKFNEAVNFKIAEGNLIVLKPQDAAGATFVAVFAPGKWLNARVVVAQ